MYFCVVLCIVCFVTYSVLFVCKCVLYYCHRVATQLQLNISYQIGAKFLGCQARIPVTISTELPGLRNILLSNETTRSNKHRHRCVLTVRQNSLEGFYKLQVNFKPDLNKNKITCNAKTTNLQKLYALQVLVHHLPHKCRQRWEQEQRMSLPEQSRRALLHTPALAQNILQPVEKTGLLSSVAAKQILSQYFTFPLRRILQLWSSLQQFFLARSKT